MNWNHLKKGNLAQPDWEEQDGKEAAQQEREGFHTAIDLQSLLLA